MSAKVPRLDRERLLGIGLRLASLAVVLAVWQWYGSDPEHFTTPPPSDVFPALWRLITEGGLLGATGGTITTVFVGLGLSVLIGIPLGFAIALFPWARNTIDPLIDAAYAMPVTMLIPIVGVYTGLDFQGRVFIVVTYVLLVIVISTTTGVRTVSRELMETGRAFGMRGWMLWRSVVLPAAMAHIASGLSTSVARAVRGAITAELLLIAADLGEYILQAQAQLQMADFLAATVWTLLVGYVLYGIALVLERRLLRWQLHGQA